MATTEYQAWIQLSSEQQLDQWRSFLTALDAGDAGYHRYYSVLMPLRDRGEVPDVINDEQLAKLDAEMAHEARWAVEHPSFNDAWEDYCIQCSDPCTNEFWARFEPVTADRILGCPPS
jgi:hypothetical protein